MNNIEHKEACIKRVEIRD